MTYRMIHYRGHPGKDEKEVERREVIADTEAEALSKCTDWPDGLNPAADNYGTMYCDYWFMDRVFDDEI